MNTELLIEHLIGGNLFAILNALPDAHSTPWVVQGMALDTQNKHVDAIWTIFGRRRPEFPIVVDASGRPTNAIEGGQILDERRNEVVAFLQNTFGLDRQQAERVVLGARA